MGNLQNEKTLAQRIIRLDTRQIKFCSEMDLNDEKVFIDKEIP